MSVSRSNSNTLTSHTEANQDYDLDLSYSLSIFQKDFKNKLNENISKLINDKKESPKLCCICSQPNLLESCSKPDCCNQFHLHCISYFFFELKYKKICPSHQFKPLKDVSKLVLLANEANESSCLTYVVKSEKTGKKQQDLTGNLFWFCISQQYFPYFKREKPEFSIEKCRNPRFSDDDSWISRKISNLSKKLETVTKTNSDLLFPLLSQSKNCCKRPKLGENIANSAKMPLNLQGKFIRNFEKIKLNSFKHSLKDYHNHVSEEKIVCAVCDDGDSDEGNLIVICSKCELAVHCSCYNIQSLPDHDWLCDKCLSQSSATCSLCPVKGGALKQDKLQSWVHITCARHLQGLPLKSFAFDSSKIESEKFKLKCFSCGFKTGACIQCSHGRCATAFHIECRKDLLEMDNGNMFWLCPNHKASKLTRSIKQSRDLSDEFMMNIANLLIKKIFGEPVVQKQKKSRKKVEPESLKKKIVMEINQDAILMKVFLGNKLVKTVKYLHEDQKSKSEKALKGMKTSKIEVDKDKLAKDDKVDKEELKVLTALQLKIKRKDKEPGVRFMKSIRGDFTVKLEVRDEVIETGNKKRQKV